MVEIFIITCATIILVLAVRNVFAAVQIHKAVKRVVARGSNIAYSPGHESINERYESENLPGVSLERLLSLMIDRYIDQFKNRTEQELKNSFLRDFSFNVSYLERAKWQLRSEKEEEVMAGSQTVWYFGGRDLIPLVDEIGKKWRGNSQVQRELSYTRKALADTTANKNGNE